MKTYSAKNNEVEKKWYVMDAKKYNFGRMAAQIAHRLKGKHKPQYTPHMDVGDFIIVINSDHLNASGRKMDNKIYHHHTGYVGHLKSISLRHLIQKDSTEVIKKAVQGMLPKGPLGRSMLKKLKVYKNDTHPHGSQMPEKLEF